MPELQEERVVEHLNMHEPEMNPGFLIHVLQRLWKNAA
jgi:hypothetical protein